MDCTPQALADAAKCVQSCLPPGEQEAVKIYLLAQIAGVAASTSDDVQALVTNAKCLHNCLPPGASKAVQVYLLCQIATTLGA